MKKSSLNRQKVKSTFCQVCQSDYLNPNSDIVQHTVFE
jgi:hypothetical protein